jgi:large repetitive protein
MRITISKLIFLMFTIISLPTLAATPPDAPSIEAVKAENTSAVIPFNPPASDGGSAILSYTASCGAGTDATGTASPLTVIGLTNGNTYNCSVIATNAVGNSAPSATKPVTLTVPDAPTIVSGTAGNTTAIIAFNLSVNNDSSAAITVYTATCGAGTDGTGANSPLTVTGLTNDTPYNCSVVATNAVGNSASSAIISVTPSTVPATPTSATTQLSNTDFTGFVTGVSVHNQAEWGYGPDKDFGVVIDESVVDDGTGNIVFRMSNAVSNGSGANLPFVPRPGGIPAIHTNLVNSLPDKFAGETTTGANHRLFYASFRFKSATGAAQAGLSVSVSPDSGIGGRMSYIGISDSGTGIDLTFYDTPGGGFVGTTIASGLNYTDWHQLKFEMLFKDGSTNDIVKIYLNDTLIHTGTSWEDYFKNAPDQLKFFPLGVFPVQTLMFKPGSAAPANNGGGYFFDDIITSLPISPDAPTIETGTAGNTTAIIAFTAPVNNGGSVITGYTASCGAGTDGTGTSSPLTVTGLTNGTSYNCSVITTNAVGDSPASATVSVTPTTSTILPGSSNNISYNYSATNPDTSPASATLLVAAATPPAGAPASSVGAVSIDSTSPTPGYKIAVTLTLSNATTEVFAGYWKYGDETGAGAAWYDYGTLASHAGGPYDGTGYTISANGKTMVIYITDGIRGDNDLLANGIIADPGLPIVIAAAVASGTPIPTLSLWGLLLMTVFLSILMIKSINRKTLI